MIASRTKLKAIMMRNDKRNSCINFMYTLVVVTGEKLVAADVTVAAVLVVVSDLEEDGS